MSESIPGERAARSSKPRRKSAWPSANTASVATVASTHIGTYVDAAGCEGPGIKLMLRLRLHLDEALKYPIDATRLGIAARIVREYLTVTGEGDQAVFSGGWHTNKKAHAEQMVTQLSRGHLARRIQTVFLPQTGCAVRCTAVGAYPSTICGNAWSMRPRTPVRAEAL